MPTPTLSVILDTAEPRITRPPITYLFDGRHWDTLKSTGFIDPITRTGMLLPLRETPQWLTTTTGLYRRLGKADYTFQTPPVAIVGQPPPYPDGTATDPSKWLEDPVDYAGNIYLTAQGVNDRARTNAVFPKNRPFLLSWFAFNSGNKRSVHMECGWLSDTGYIALRIWSDGKAEIYKNGELVGEGNIFERKVTSQTIYGKQKTSENVNKHTKGDSRQMQGEFVDLYLIPCRRRDLLLLSNKGGGFRFTFEDLDADNPDNEITPDNARFVWEVPAPGQPKVLCAPLNFLTTGTLISDIRGSRLAPDVGEEPTCNVVGDDPGYGDNILATASVLETDGSTAFVPDGSKTRLRLQVALTGDGQSTPFVYAADAVYDAQTADTDSDHLTELVDFILHADLSVPDNASDVSFKATLKSPELIEQITDAAGIREITNRPVECAMQDGSTWISFLTGRSKGVSWKEATSDTARELMLEFRDRCQAMEEYRFSESVPYDGVELADALSSIAVLPGYDPAEVDIPQFGFPLPTVGGQSQGEWVLRPEVGDKCIDWFTRLMTTFAAGFQWGWVPTAGGTVLQVRSLDQLEAGASQLTLYPTTQDAIDHGIDRAFAPYYLYRTSNTTRIPCEANDLWVEGQDPRTGLPLLFHWEDKKSKDPTLAPADRPSNWVGEPREYGWCDRAIVNRDIAGWVMGNFTRRLAVTRDIVAFDAFYMFRPDGAPVWRGDVVTLFGIGNVRITALSGRFTNEFSGDTPAEDRIWRDFHYTSEIVYASTV